MLPSAPAEHKPRQGPAATTDATIVTEETVFEGQVSGWRLDGDGTVRFSLDITQPEKATLWFRTPPNLSSTTRMEGRLIDLLLTLGDRTTIRTAVAEPEVAEDVADAVEVLWVSGGF